jgi:hypothetical protein
LRGIGAGPGEDERGIGVAVEAATPEPGARDLVEDLQRDPPGEVKIAVGALRFGRERQVCGGKDGKGDEAGAGP